MTNWLSRWFGKPTGKTVLRPSMAANPPRAAPADANGGTAWKPGDLILGEYRVVRELGHGSMGTVHLVVNAKSPELKFAVKRIRVAGDVYRRNFVAELQTWIGLAEHPNLVACRFFRTVGDDLVIFAQYVDGAPLSRRIAEKKLTDIESVLDLAIQFAWGLHAAHEQGVVHQDVKPANALVAADGTVKIADFGLARAQTVPMQAPEAGSDYPILVAHAGGMTDEYCSPEQAKGEPLSRRSDLWSWAVSVLEMFTGKVTWRSGVLAPVALRELLEAQAHGVAPGDGQLRMPESVAAVLHRCFSDEPNLRWPTMLAAAQELIEAYRGICGGNHPRSAPAPLHREPGAKLDRLYLDAEWSDPKAWLIEALKAAGRDPAEADTLARSTAGVHGRKVQAVADLGTYQEAQAIFERLIAAGRGELRERLAWLLMSQARVHDFSGDLPGATRANDRAIAMYERLVGQEDRRDLSGHLAEAYMNKAASVSDLGNKQDAVGLIDRAIAICESLASQEGQPKLSNCLASAYMNKGFVVWAQGDSQAAFGLHGRAIVIYERLVDKEGTRELTRDLARAYMNQALAAKALGDPQAAVHLYDRSIAIRERLVNQEGRRARP